MIFFESLTNAFQNVELSALEIYFRTYLYCYCIFFSYIKIRIEEKNVPTQLKMHLHT